MGGGGGRRTMDLIMVSVYSVFLLNLTFLLPVSQGATFTFTNKCSYTVWPGILSNAGTPTLTTTGFELQPTTSHSILAPTGWSGRFWGRTGCNFQTSSTPGTCSTGDCGSGSLECNGAGATPPATLAEFTLSSGVGQDFYDVSLVDGYNLPMTVEPSTAGSGSATTNCVTTGCVVDVNRLCPNELRVGDGLACKSACLAFDTPRYCCSGIYGTSESCKPSVYSEVFKSACPRSYSYAYDDASSTFTCNSGADYTITFCPAGSSPSQKSTTTPVTPVPTPSTITPPPVTITPPFTTPNPTPDFTPTVTTPSTTPDASSGGGSSGGGFESTTPDTSSSSSGGGGGFGSQFPSGGSMNYEAGTGTTGSSSSSSGDGGEFGSSSSSSGGDSITAGGGGQEVTPDSSAGSQSSADAMADGSWVTNMAMGEGRRSNAASTMRRRRDMKNPTSTILISLFLCVVLSLLLLP